MEDALAAIIDNVSLYFSGQNKEDAQPPVRRRLPRSHIGMHLPPHRAA
tara:strand:- start:76 stop:219 length:144 start_codon:yes stop_codon:yes gene_type:complete